MTSASRTICTLTILLIIALSFTISSNFELYKLAARYSDLQKEYSTAILENKILGESSLAYSNKAKAHNKFLH